MKKFSFILLCFLSVVFVGCNNLKVYDYVKNNIAEYRQNLYVGENEKIAVSLTSGCREKDYVVNGLCTNPIEFAVLTFNLKQKQTMPETVNYVLTVGTSRYDGLLEKNPYNGSYVCDIKKIIESSDVITAKIIAGDFVEYVELKSVTDNWNVNYDNALRLACVELKNELLTLIENNEFYGECYIKIINDEVVSENHYFWYVNFVSRSGKTFAVVIDPISNEIMTKKVVWLKRKIFPFFYFKV